MSDENIMASAEEEVSKTNEEDTESKTEETSEATEDAAKESKTVQEETDGDTGEDTGVCEDDSADTADAEGTPAKKKLFGRKDKKDKRDEKIAELEEMRKRQLAEFENFRNRSEREKSQRFEMGEKNVLEKILPVVDNFERGFAGVDENSEDPFVKGMAQVYKQLQNVLTDMGVEPIEAVGCDFDPNLHNAVMQAQSDELESGKIAAELQKGYKYKDSVLRHSMVSVVQ
jgi:molecular chaperone GrpE